MLKTLILMINKLKLINLSIVGMSQEVGYLVKYVKKILHLMVIVLLFELFINLVKVNNGKLAMMLINKV
jgi:hypothetical protein